MCEGQKETKPNQAFNKVIHVDLIDTDTNSKGTSSKTILSITDDTRTFTQVAVIANSEIDSTVSAIWHLWCQPYGPPETIMFNQGKVRTSKLESRINNFMPLAKTISCRSQKDTFNQEIQQQWRQNQKNISAEEFARNLNLLYNFQGPAKSETDHGHLSDAHQYLDDVEDFMEDQTDLEEEKLEALRRDDLKRKRISLCRHKLQGLAYPKCRNKKMTQKQLQQFPEQEELDFNHEWLQLIQMEKFIENQNESYWKMGPKTSTTMTTPGTNTRRQRETRSKEKKIIWSTKTWHT
jgi:hypothetical protein